jgi:tetratricopeptide (TPR) repeat protein
MSNARQHVLIAATRQGLLPAALWCLLALASLALSASGATLDETRAWILKGEYAAAITAASAGIADEPAQPEWPLLKAEALSAVGRYAEAKAALAEAASAFPLHLPLRLALYHAARQTGATAEARAHLIELDRIGGGRPWAYREPADKVALGRVALLVNADPKRVLELFFEPVRTDHPDLPISYLASGDLALAKSDFALAGKHFTAATKRFPEHPEAWFGLARALAPSSLSDSTAALQRALALNPSHVPSWLLLAEHHIDSENFDQAGAAIREALSVHPHRPEAHALRAVLAHLNADASAAEEARAAALATWAQNPAVPHLIGRKLSQKYRFSEGAALQREALAFDPDFLPAKAQLANDLLRLGDDEEGWTLAEQVHQADPYDVVAYNLVTLRQAMARLRTIESKHFRVRMDPKEADVYGVQVLELLERAHATLTQKYGLTLHEKTIVELFPDQKDFAIRTFGLPGGAGYLGVCFGRVITANSPLARPGSSANWQAILWHEFCHVVTLTLTQNKMPRWLSEGVSVYEERQVRAVQANPAGAWGEQMRPIYRRMILSDDLTPVSQLSGAFLRPQTPAHLGFAYYQSSLVVEWLIERWGIDQLKKVLIDLGRGLDMNAALARHYLPIEKLDAEFAAHARALARKVGPKLDWARPEPRQLATRPATEAFLEKNPANFDALMLRASHHIEAREWEKAKAPLQTLIAEYPDQRDPENAYVLLAMVHRELGETHHEIPLLTRFADLSAEATGAFERLMEYHAAQEDWPKVLDYAARLQAVNPMRPESHRLAARAHLAMNAQAAAIQHYQTLATLDPPDVSTVHYELARLLHAAGDRAAKRHVFIALEESPRFREAHKLLLDIQEKEAAP